MTVSWIAPAAGVLTNQIELTFGQPVYTVTFDAQVSGMGTPIFFEHVAGDLPQYSEIIQSGSNTADFVIEPLVRELDQYVPAFARPPDFTFDTEDTAGGNYATFGSALAGGFTFNFTIRAHDASGFATFIDSNGRLQYITDSNFGSNFEDRNFTIQITNNWSSDRDNFILEYYEGQKIRYNGVDYDPEDFLIAIKSDGFYI